MEEAFVDEAKTKYVKSLEDELAELKMEGVLNQHRQRQITVVLKMIDHLSDEEE